MHQFGIGPPVRRKGDVQPLTDGGADTYDIDLSSKVHLAFLRSFRAHSRTIFSDVGAAPGVLHG